jgi:N-acetyl-gamma-glutamyl-phosphate reductase
MPYVSIVGASGYTGQETLDRVLRHPELELYAVGSDSLADATFLCLPHEDAAAFEPAARGVVIDLSGAHRLTDPAQYETWYGFEHPRPDELGGWSYGLPELTPPHGRLVANPGCYATAVLLALGPVAAAIDPESVVVDAMSGMTGAGRSLRPTTHAGSVLENVSPYKVGAHQHVAEIAQLLGFPVSFTPHLLPVRRGLLATCNVRSTGTDLRALLEEHYAASPVVTVLSEGVAPELARVQHTDGAEIGVFDDRHTDRTIVICALDNLGKGAAGQAVQNVNALYGLSATSGLRLAGVPV